MLLTEKSRVSGRDFVLAYNRVTACGYKDVPAIDRVRAVISLMEGNSARVHEKRIYDLVIDFWNRRATDFRDKIYALIGISSDACNSLFLRPNYNLELDQIVYKLVLFSLGIDNLDKIKNHFDTSNGLLLLHHSAFQFDVRSLSKDQVQFTPRATAKTISRDRHQWIAQIPRQQDQSLTSDSVSILLFRGANTPILVKSTFGANAAAGTFDFVCCLDSVKACHEKVSTKCPWKVNWTDFVKLLLDKNATRHPQGICGGSKTDSPIPFVAEAKVWWNFSTLIGVVEI